MASRDKGAAADGAVRPDALVFTGDLTDLGEPGAYARLRVLVEPVGGPPRPQERLLHGLLGEPRVPERPRGEPEHLTAVRAVRRADGDVIEGVRNRSHGEPSQDTDHGHAGFEMDRPNFPEHVEPCRSDARRRGDTIANHAIERKIQGGIHATDEDVRTGRRADARAGGVRQRRARVACRWQKSAHHSVLAKGYT
jgi:hypothetical protein